MPTSGRAEVSARPRLGANIGPAQLGWQREAHCFAESNRPMRSLALPRTRTRHFGKAFSGRKQHFHKLLVVFHLISRVAGAKLGSFSYDVDRENFGARERTTPGRAR
jgi:hypothetical protein